MYQVIARKYRPQSFADLVNQEHIKGTLSNAIEQRRIAHGYIFSGQRGTGKTTVARIMARCLNCVEGPTMTPCGKCSSCLEVSAGNSVDVIEIDAASNRGINEMRELRESVRFRPARDRYKVFIIDEAHQITNDAFNALLKTLEEPPEWVVFMLCTTESHKLPATISSRCQHFSFRSVEMDELVERMQWICSQEGIEADGDALMVLAQAGGGSVRDSLSALDQAIACCGNTLNAEQVRLLMGAYSLDTLTKVTSALETENAQTMLELVDELERSGQNLQHFCREIAAYFRNLLVAKVAGANPRLIAAAKSDVDRLTSIAERFSERDLTRYLNIVLEVFGQLQHSLQPRFHLELGLLRLIHAGRLSTVEQALAELRRGVDGPAGGAPPSGRASGGGAAGSGGTGGTGFAGGVGLPGGSGRTGMTSSATPSASAGGAGSGSRPVFRSASANFAAAPVYAAAPEAAPEMVAKAVEPSEEQVPVERPVEASVRKPGAVVYSFPEAGAVRGVASPEVEKGAGSGIDATPSAETDLAQEAGSEVEAGPRPEVGMAEVEVAASTPAASEVHERLIAILNETGKRFTADAIERAQVTMQVLPSGGVELGVVAPRDTSLSVKEADLREALKQAGIAVQRVKLEFGDVDAAPELRKPRGSADDEALRREVEADPDVQYIRELFHGTITRVRSLRA